MVKTRQAGAGFVAVIFALFNFVIMIPYLGPASMLTGIMGDLGVPVSMGGLVISVYLIMCGLCMFVGSIVCNRLGFRETFILGLSFVTLGLVLSAIAGNFGVYFLGRTVSGVGYGLAQSALFPIAAIWFHGPKFATIQTVITTSSCLGVALAYIVFPLFGTWKTATWVFAAITLAYTLLSLLWVKYPEDIGESLKQARTAVKAGKAPRQKAEFARVFQYRDFVLIMVISIFTIIPNTILLTYMVTYFTKEAGMSVALATTVSSILTIVQIIGSILGGVLCNTTGHRKPVIIVSTAMYGVASIGLVAFGHAVGLVIACAVLSGIGFYMKMPVVSMYMVEETETPEPAFIPAIAAITSGLPLLLNLVGSIAGGRLITGMGIGTTIVIMHVLALAMVIPALLLHEVGPKSKRVESAKDSV